MKNLLVMALLIFSMLFVTGCVSQSEQFHYKDTLVDGDAGTFEENVLAEEIKVNKQVDFDLSGEDEQIYKDDDLNIYFSDITYADSFRFYFTSYYTNVASLHLCFTFSDGTIESKDVNYVNMIHSYLFDCNWHSGKITNVQVTLTPTEVRTTGIQQLDDKKGDIVKTGQNTIKSNINGSVAVMDRYGTVKDTLDVKKGEKYTVCFGATMYEEFKGGGER